MACPSVVYQPVWLMVLLYQVVERDWAFRPSLTLCTFWNSSCILRAITAPRPDTLFWSSGQEGSDPSATTQGFCWSALRPLHCTPRHSQRTLGIQLALLGSTPPCGTLMVGLEPVPNPLYLVVGTIISGTGDLDSHWLERAIDV